MKREPVTIDVKPEELHVERPRQRINGTPRPVQRSRVSQMREIERVGRIVQSPDFWLGVLADLWEKRK